MHLNKIGLLALSMSAIFMASSCNKANTKVTEEEFNNAISFSGTKYLQINVDSVVKMTFGGISSETTASGKSQLAPNVSYVVAEGTESKQPTYVETYATAKDDTVTYITRKAKKDEFTKGTIGMNDPGRTTYYQTPQENSYAPTLEQFDIKFKDLKYANDAYTITKSGTSKEGSGSIDISFYFSNKKLSKVKCDMSVSSEEPMKAEMNTKYTHKLAYKELTPTKPTK